MGQKWFKGKFNPKRIGFIGCPQNIVDLCQDCINFRNLIRTGLVVTN